MKKKRSSTQTKKNQIGCFFQISISQVKRVAAHCSLDALIGYFILNWGVDNSAKVAGQRLCGYGAQSIFNNSDMSERRAAGVIRELLASGVIEQQTLGDQVGPPFLVLYGECRDLVAISSNFVGGRESPLIDLCRRVHDPFETDADIDREQAVKDALLLFLSLHDRMDLAAFSGVDPRLIHGDFTPEDIQRSFSAGNAVGLCPQFRFVTVREPGEQRLSPTFVVEVFKDMPAPNCQAVIYQRADHAHRRLRELGFLYEAYVLYPRDPMQSLEMPRPVATLFLRGASLRLEIAVQHDVNDVLDRHGCLPEGVARRNRRSDRMEVGVYRFIAPAAVAAAWTVVAQTRVRHWPFDQKHVQANQADQFRCEDYVNSIRKITAKEPA